MKKSRSQQSEPKNRGLVFRLQASNKNPHGDLFILGPPALILRPLPQTPLSTPSLQVWLHAWVLYAPSCQAKRSMRTVTVRPPSSAPFITCAECWASSGVEYRTIPNPLQPEQNMKPPSARWSAPKESRSQML